MIQGIILQEGVLGSLGGNALNLAWHVRTRNVARIDAGEGFDVGLQTAGISITSALKCRSAWETT